MHVDFPEKCYLNKSVVLIVSVDEEYKTFDFLVFISGSTFQSTLHWCTIRGGEEKKFVLIPKEIGTQIIEVELLYGTSRSAYIVIQTEVVEGKE